MEAFKGTPAPWHIVEVRKHPQHKNQQIAFIQTPRICLDLSSIESDRFTRSEFEANAQLIAVAPELLEMLIDHRKRISDLRDIMENQHSMWSHHRQLFNDLLNESEELISKALGNK